MLKIIFCIVLMQFSNSNEIEFEISQIEIKNYISKDVSSIDRLYMDKDQLFFLDIKRSSLSKLDLKSTSVVKLLSAGNGPNELKKPVNMTYDALSNRLVINANFGRVDYYSIKDNKLSTEYVKTSMTLINRVISFNDNVIVGGSSINDNKRVLAEWHNRDGERFDVGEITEGFGGFINYKMGGSDAVIFNKTLIVVELSTYKVYAIDDKMNIINTYKDAEHKLLPRLKESDFPKFTEIIKEYLMIRYIYSTEKYLIVELMKYMDFNSVYIDVFNSNMEKILSNYKLNGYVLGVDYYQNIVLTSNPEEQEIEKLLINKYEIIERK